MLIGRKPLGTVAFLAGVPAVLTDFWWSCVQMVQYANEYMTQPNEYIHWDRATISFHSWARNAVVDRMQGDWLLFLDTDHSFEPDIVSRLHDRMYSYDLDVVCGVYQYRNAPHPPVLFAWKQELAEDGKILAEGYVNVGGWIGQTTPIFEVAAAGGGCLMVRRRVFDRIKTELNERPFDVLGQAGEDMSFFSRLRKLGVKTFVDTRIECPHLMVRPLTLDDYDQSQATLEALPDTVGLIPN